jgi:hypothetical protein
LRPPDKSQPNAKEAAMIEYIQSNEDVIALKITGKLMREELDEITTRVEKSLAEREKTHIFVEIEDFSGFDVAALPEYLPRAAAMLGQLGRFGRIAVVSDRRWIRWATKLESALLPHISYETFTADERHRALAWVEGKLNPLHDPSIRIIETDKPDVLGFELDGRISTADAEAVADYFNKALDRNHPLRLLGRVKNIDGAELSALFGHKYLQMRVGMLERIERYAIVGGPLWLCAWVSALDPLVSAELRHFPADKEAQAWDWLGAQPKAKQAEAA